MSIPCYRAVDLVIRGLPTSTQVLLQYNDAISTQTSSAALEVFDEESIGYLTGTPLRPDQTILDVLRLPVLQANIVNLAYTGCIYQTSGELSNGFNDIHRLSDIEEQAFSDSTNSK